jgi:hypothetical protein
VGAAQDLLEANLSTATITKAAGWKNERMLSRYTGNQRAKKGELAELYARRHK